MPTTLDELKKKWGLAPAFAEKIWVLFHALETNGLNPVITSGHRDPFKQEQMRARWDKGDRVGLRARPAADSLHVVTVNGHAAAQAVDIKTNNDKRAAEIAAALNIGAGYYFKISDPGHFYDKGARVVKAAKVAGGGFVALAIGAAIFFFLKRSKKNKKQ
jgi:hypothetical protein